MTASSGSATADRPAAGLDILLVYVGSPSAAAERLQAALAATPVAVQPGDDPLAPSPGRADAVLVDAASDDPMAAERALDLVARLADGPAPVLVVGDRLPTHRRIALYRAGAVGVVGPDEAPAELLARVASLSGAARTAARAIARLREHSRRLDEQLRLAQRLQMDFLPRRMPAMDSARFAARLEPAAWVAGDFYDIFRLDEQHVGFYVADAVGHGIPAALLTVFVKKSLRTKHIEGKHYELIPPPEALRLLNADLLSAELQETPFITMVYGLYNEVTRECVWARAGHPEPLLLDSNAALEPLAGGGPLLGIFPDATFDTCRRTLEPGQRLLLYSDGAERVESDRRSNPDRLREVIQTAALLPLEALLDAVLDAVRGATGGRRLADDVTLVALEVADGADGSA
ncbi:MAG: SpoIIE family protein phosphatase [Planctomycetes bacterium]|nr:SpoIIE family protein phosphatase [Planctomycetota bacterium]